MVLLLAFGARTADAQGLPDAWIPFVGARYSNVQGASVSAFVLRERSKHFEEYSGWFGGGEVGLHGWSASVGSGTWAAVGGGSYRATFLRTYGSDGRLAGGQSFIGGEARFSIWWVTLGGGWYHRVAGHAPGDGSSFAFTVGMGY